MPKYFRILLRNGFVNDGFIFWNERKEMLRNVRGSNDFLEHSMIFLFRTWNFGCQTFQLDSERSKRPL